MGLAVPVYGRRGHLRAVFERSEGGGPVICDRIRIGTRYCYREYLNIGRVCWSLKRLGRGDELRPIFLQVLTDCLVWQ
jgi:hypothetical protein